MFDIGGEEFLLLVILGLLIFGPRRLPQIGRQLGGFIGQMRAAMREFQGTLEREVALEEMKGVAKDLAGLKNDAQGIARDVAGLAAYASGSPDPIPTIPPPAAPPAEETPATADERPPAESNTAVETSPSLSAGEATSAPAADERPPADVAGEGGASEPKTEEKP